MSAHHLPAAILRLAVFSALPTAVALSVQSGTTTVSVSVFRAIWIS